MAYVRISVNIFIDRMASQEARYNIRSNKLVDNINT